MIDNEIIKALENTEVKKIKAIYPHIVVGGTADKPCYSIDWYDIEAKTMLTGYSSYNLKIVQEWLKEYFEVVEDDIENLINRLKEKDETRHKVFETKCEELEIAKAEIERLKKGWKADVILTANIKAEAYKEFAERLKEEKHICLPPVGYPVDENDWVIYEDDIDSVLKEMVGEDNAT